MKTHPELGYEILQEIDFLKETAKIIRYYHGNYDGTGYPEGLEAEETPLGARILRIAESYEVMTSDQPYRPALSDSQALSELQRCARKDFDPQLVELFVAMIDVEQKSLRQYSDQEIEEALNVYNLVLRQR